MSRMEIQIQCLQHGHPRSLLRILPRTADSQQEATEANIRGAAPTIDEGERWIQANNNLRYVLITTTGAAATLRRQHQGLGEETGLEIYRHYRQLCQRFATPVETRSVAYLTKLLKPTFHDNVEESFAEFKVNRYEGGDANTTPRQRKYCRHEQDNSTLQQHLYLNAGNQATHAEARATIMDHKSATAFQ